MFITIIKNHLPMQDMQQLSALPGNDYSSQTGRTKAKTPLSYLSGAP